MRVAITGGNGYIGRNLTKFLIKEGHEVVIVSRTGDANLKFAEEGIDNVIFDILEPFDTDPYLLLGKPDILVHLAWKDGFAHDSLSHIRDITGHLRFLESLFESGLKHVAVSGSMHEIGYFVGEVDENTATNPKNSYGIAKDFLRRSLELLCKQYSVTYQWLRIFYIYGDDEFNNSIFTKLLKANNEGKSHFDLNIAELLYDFIHIDELVHQITLVITQSKINGIINCCTNEPISLKTMVENFVKMNDLNLKINYGAYPLRPYDSRALWGSNKKLNLIKLNTNK